MGRGAKSLVLAATLLGASAAAAEAALSRGFAGVYKRHFRSALTARPPGETEDSLLMVPVADAAVYFKTSLSSYNGHACELFGIARYQPQSGNFLFVDPEARTHHCRMQIVVSPKTLSFKDDPEVPCRGWYCGQRGQFTGADFERSQKRPVRDLKAVVDSLDYKSSVAALTGTP